jgi:hypothetical protein
LDPGKPMSISAFLDIAARDGWGGVQLCENLGYADRSDADLAVVAAQGDRLQLFVEIGFNCLTDKNLGRHKVEAGYFVTGAVLGKGMLDLPAVLRCAAAAPNLRSIILEMTVKRDETALVEAVIHREQEAVLESRDYLLQGLSKVFSFECHP